MVRLILLHNRNSKQYCSSQCSSPIIEIMIENIKFTLYKNKKFPIN